MPCRTDLESILIIGAGPIVIGQACEFDYSGVQACRALKEEGYRVILINSNPATIMTDPAIADATYIEPITWQFLRSVIKRENIDAILPTMGGQTALNCSLDLVREGVLDEFSVQLIGASHEAISCAEDRQQFAEAMRSIGLETPVSGIAHSIEEALQCLGQIGFPAIVRPSFTLGGAGGGIAYNREEYIDICRRGLDLSPTRELLIDKSLIGWKEFEMEVVRDSRDNCIVVCSIENVDAMGIHTGDSITVAPAQTLTDREYQQMRNASIAVLRRIGVDTGGSNVQFAVDPATGRQLVIEMNPRVSRSSALASKATGFPIARIAAKLAVGYTLDELDNEITGKLSPASFEPSIDYVVTKMPRFAFEKFSDADSTLSTQMKSVGEVMAVGRTFQESLQKAISGLETGVCGLEFKYGEAKKPLREEICAALSHPEPERILWIAEAFRRGFGSDEIYSLSHIDPWFLHWIGDLVDEERELTGCELLQLDHQRLLEIKRKGFSDKRLAQLLNCSERRIRERRKELNITPVFKRVDTCAGEFPTVTGYLYSTYEAHCEVETGKRRRIMVLGGGPNRIGQGIEFDYCCVHAVASCRASGYETIMVNCNPETVSTDYDISDRLYFEPITLEHVLAIVEVEKPDGVMVQFGGQTPLNLVRSLEKEGVPILGTSSSAIYRAEDREQFAGTIEALGLKQASNAIVRNAQAAEAVASQIGFPLMVRPSWVLGGRAMEIVYNTAELLHYIEDAVKVSDDSPILLDRFLNNAVELDIDAVSDGEQVVIGGIMQHIEEAGIHSGDSACCLPPRDLSLKIQNEARAAVVTLAKELGVIGLINVQLAVQGGILYIIEVNPRASRTVPFVSKATGCSLAAVAARCMIGVSLQQQGFVSEPEPSHIFVKEAVFPFARFPEVDPILGPEMKSTGEVMGIGDNFAEAFARAQMAAGAHLSAVRGGSSRPIALLSVRDSDKSGIVPVARRLIKCGFSISATANTAAWLERAELKGISQVKKVAEGRPHIVDLIKDGAISFIINTTEGKQSIRDSAEIRRVALQNRVLYATTLSGGEAYCEAFEIDENLFETTRKLQDLQSPHSAVTAIFTDTQRGNN